VVSINEYQKRRFVKTMIHEMFNTVADKRIALLGFAFKKDTGDTRDSPALVVARQLIEERAIVVISDPKAVANARAALSEAPPGRVIFEQDPYLATRGAHAIALLTEWDAYRTLDYEKIFASMEKPAFVFDGRNLLDHEALYRVGFSVFPIGKPPLKQF
jgi:UDPglucose 6-dehydrogenase